MDTRYLTCSNVGVRSCYEPVYHFLEVSRLYQALYRKYRPQTFDDVVGQMAITQTLKTQLQSGKLSHAYLFTGSRGTGKTTSAKILAKAVNCENSVDGNPCNCCDACRSIDDGSCMDVLEIDAASNNGVDNVRSLRDDAIYSPSQVKKRVYIIDEVHMLSLSAFNALLKIIEEPPEHLLFILATTELHKVPATILSRCQRFSFRRISQEDIASRLQYVAYQENIELEAEAARVLARLADGGMRDGLSLLDQCASATTGDLTAEKVYACLGIAGIQDCGKLMECVSKQDTAAALAMVSRYYSEGKDMAALMDELACLTRDLMILKTAPKEGIGMLSGIASDQQALALADVFSFGELIRILNLIQQTVAGFTRSVSRRLDVETCIVNLCRPELTLEAEALNARITRLEDQMKSGVMPVAAKSSEQAEETPATVAPISAPEPVKQEPDLQPDEAWDEVCQQVAKEIEPRWQGIVTDKNSVVGYFRGPQLFLVCSNIFVKGIFDNPVVNALVARKASAHMGKPITVVVTNDATKVAPAGDMEQLIRFSQDFPGIVNFK